MEGIDMPKETIKKRLVSNFMIIIIVTVFIFEFLLIGLVKKYYYTNVEDALINQVKISASLYEKYFSNRSLEENVLEDIDVFWQQTDAQVQIIDFNGNVIMDSIGVSYDGPISSNDIQRALKGEIGKYVGSVFYDEDNVMIISHPLKSNNEIVGVIRFIATLKWIDMVIKNISYIFLAIGALVMVIGVAVSLFLAKTITEPIEALTQTAQRVSEGEFHARAKIFYNDEIGELSKVLNYMCDEIIKREQLKNEFISSVSHEIRTPLTAIKGWALLLNKGIVTDEETMKEGMEILEKESERLTKMVEELLDFSKLISGRISIELKTVDIKEIIEYVETYMISVSYERNIDFKVILDDKLPFIKLDVDKIKQVLINVLDNAFKFCGEKGRVKLVVKNEKNKIHIYIEDNGCGISSEELPRVVEKFYKGKNSNSNNGIGLSICDEIIKMHKGHLKIDSVLGEGTIVHIYLPVGVEIDEN